MKKYLFLIIALALFISACEETNLQSGELVGVWQLSEVLADPGDGSGTFQPATEDFKISFLAEGKLWIDQGLFCTPSLKLFHKSNGSYDTVRNIIISEECASADFTPEYTYEINEDNELIVYLLCIEPCANKFVKISR